MGTGIGGFEGSNNHYMPSYIYSKGILPALAEKYPLMSAIVHNGGVSFTLGIIDLHSYAQLHFTYN